MIGSTAEKTEIVVYMMLMLGRQQLTVLAQQGIRISSFHRTRGGRLIVVSWSVTGLGIRRLSPRITRIGLV